VVRQGRGEGEDVRRPPAYAAGLGPWQGQQYGQGQGPGQGGVQGQGQGGVQGQGQGQGRGEGAVVYQVQGSGHARKPSVIREEDQDSVWEEAEDLEVALREQEG